MAEITTSQEKLDLQKLIKETYIDGHVLYSPDLYRQILHPDWKMYHLVDGWLEIVDREEFCSWYAPEKRDPELEWTYSFESVDISGTAAQVKLRLGNQKVSYTDYLNLLKIDGTWWIVNKIYQESRPAES